MYVPALGDTVLFCKSPEKQWIKNNNFRLQTSQSPPCIVYCCFELKVDGSCLEHNVAARTNEKQAMQQT
jgi:hypothetical protein